jgi:hypothetical protein
MKDTTPKRRLALLFQRFSTDCARRFPGGARN